MYENAPVESSVNVPRWKLGACISLTLKTSQALESKSFASAPLSSSTVSVSPFWTL